MTKLSMVADEARRLAGKASEASVRTRGNALRELCAAHWAELRGPEPSAGIGRALWDARPALADLLMSLVVDADPRLAAILGRLEPHQALAMLVLAEIERGEAEEARRAYEAMRLYEPPSVADPQARRAHARLRGEPPAIDEGHPRSTATPIAKTLTAIAVATGRDDLNAVVAVMECLGRLQASTTVPDDDPLAQRLLGALDAIGVTLLGFGGDRLRYRLHGTERKTLSRSRLAQLLREIRPS
jgi:hypothetical protein